HSGGISGKVHGRPGHALPVVLRVALGLAPEAGREAREGPGKDEDPLFSGAALLTALAQDHALDARQHDPGRSRFDRQKAEPMGLADVRAAGLRLPHMIKDGAAILEELLLEPPPYRWIEHLAGAEHPLDGAEIAAFGGDGAAAHQEPRGRG